MRSHNTGCEEKKSGGLEKKDCGGQKRRFVGQKRGVVGQKRRVVGRKRRVAGVRKKCLWVRKEGLRVRKDVLWVRKEGRGGQKSRVAGVRKKGLWVRKEGLRVRKDGLWVRKEGCGGQKKWDCESIGSHGQHRHSDEEERDAEGERICFLSVERARGVRGHATRAAGPTVLRGQRQQRRGLEKNLEVKKKPRGYNSFVASNDNHTYQIGICFPRMI